MTAIADGFCKNANVWFAAAASAAGGGEEWRKVDNTEDPGRRVLPLLLLLSLDIVDDAGAGIGVVEDDDDATLYTAAL